MNICAIQKQQLGYSFIAWRWFTLNTLIFKYLNSYLSCFTEVACSHISRGFRSRSEGATTPKQRKSLGQRQSRNSHDGTSPIITALQSIIGPLHSLALGVTPRVPQNHRPSRSRLTCLGSYRSGMDEKNPKPLRASTTVWGFVKFGLDDRICI